MADPVETPVADAIRRYGGWTGEIVGLFIPGAGIVAKLITDAPLGEFEQYLRGRARDGRLETTEVTPPEAVSFP